jgi:hypothetical protein
MKKILAIAAVAFLFTACQSNTKNGANTATTDSANVKPVAIADAPKVEFEKETYDFGIITPGEKVQYDFKFKNTGKTPLIITNATASCGCTVPEYPKQPVKPGEEALIKVVFNSEGKMGKQDKVVTMTSNANPEMSQLHLVGEIKEKK